MISYKYEKNIINLLLLLLVFMFFSNINVSFIDVYNNFFVLLTFTIGIVFTGASFHKYRISKNNIKIILISSIIVILYSIGIIKNLTLDAFITTVKITLLMMFCIFVSQLDFKNKSCFRILDIGILIYLLFYSLIIFKYGRESVATNSFGMVNTIVVYFSFLVYYNSKINYKSKLKLIFIIIILIILSLKVSARSSILVLFISLLVFLFWNIISKNKIIYFLFFIILFISIMLFIYFYTYGDEIPLFIKLNEISNIYFNKNFFSGRNIIWKNLFEYIKLKPILGYGSGVTNEVFSVVQNSTHNFYIQVLLQVGLAGLLSWILFFYQIWRFFYKCKKDKIIRITSSFFVAILIQNIFELTFYSNKVIIGIMQWLIIAIGLSIVNQSEK